MLVSDYHVLDLLVCNANLSSISAISWRGIYYMSFTHGILMY